MAVLCTKESRWGGGSPVGRREHFRLAVVGRSERFRLAVVGRSKLAAGAGRRPYKNLPTSRNKFFTVQYQQQQLADLTMKEEVPEAFTQFVILSC